MLPLKPDNVEVGMAFSMDYIQRMNRAVADQLFPNRTATTMFLKLYEEVGEVVRKPDDPGEIADVIIMLLDHADRNGIDVGMAVLEKLKINLGRQWRVDPETNVAYHVETVQ